MNADRRPRPRRGFSLMELTVVMAIMGVLVTLPVPTFRRALEQSKLDTAAGQLRSIWAAERFYRLENGVYGSMSDLAGARGGSLVDASLSASAGSTSYQYAITLGDDRLSFVATATHPDQPGGTGALTIDQDGTLTSTVTFDGAALTPSRETQP